MTQHPSQPDPVTTELLGWIQQATDRIGRSTDGLTEAQVRTPAARSGWSIAGLVGHVHDSTWFWLHHVIAGNPMQFGEDDGWDNDPALPFPELVARLRGDTARGCAAVAALASTDAPGWWPEGAWGGYRQDTVRGVLVHLLNDNAAHTGHLDLAREAIDGGVWDYGIDGVRLPD
ncbi:DinB family protein [Actinocatenispora sera]|uniref:DinB family protein n=1 Tax=Actinocatenispora sera TaxID=390989 RepID=UPI003405E037